MAIEIKIQKRGNNLGFVLPKEFVKEHNIKENSSVIIEIMKKSDLTKVLKKT